MKYTFFLLLIFSFSFTDLSAQQDHFLYFQTEASQAFYIKLAGKVFSSSTSGYLIMPKLKEGNYKLVIGFPKNEWPEEVVNYNLEKDAGFLLKNLSDQGWGLYDFQSSNIIIAGEKLANKNVSTDVLKKDNFSEMLATVVNDSTIREVDIVAKDDTQQIVKEKVKDIAEPAAPEKGGANKTDSAIRNLYSLISKDLLVKSQDGIEMIYTDQYNNAKDTVRIFMPVNGDKAADGTQQSQPAKSDTRNDTNRLASEIPLTNPVTFNEQKNEAAAIIADAANTESAVVNNNMPGGALQSDTSYVLPDTAKNIAGQQLSGQQPLPAQKSDTAVIIDDTSKSITKDKIEFLPPKTGMLNSNCRQYATEDDFLKLRKKMAAENNDDKMINDAKKIFKAKCFATKDIKNLSALFLNDGGKYNFFDAAYPYVSDSDMFYTLETQLSDAYYIKRFQAMIQH